MAREAKINSCLDLLPTVGELFLYFFFGWITIPIKWLCKISKLNQFDVDKNSAILFRGEVFLDSAIRDFGQWNWHHYRLLIGFPTSSRPERGEYGSESRTPSLASGSVSEAVFSRCKYNISPSFPLTEGHFFIM